MRWSNFFDGYESLWDAEGDGAEWDERRELVRADRATQTFRQVISSHKGRPIAAIAAGVGGTLHLRRLGANWVDGTLCATSERVLVPLARLDAMSTSGGCDCTPVMLSVFDHVTIGAALRELERAQASVSAQLSTGGAHGLVTAVWKDAVSIRSGVITVTVQLGSLHSLIVRGS